MARPKCLVVLGSLLCFALYVIQACLLVKFMAENIHQLCWICVVLFIPALVCSIIFVFKCGYADNDREARYVWIIWAIYITVGFVPSVAVIFFKVAEHLSHHDTFGPNTLKSVLCITPALLVLLLHLSICPSYRKYIMSISIAATLDLFDGVEMLEIVLMQNEREDFNLSEGLEIPIIIFACICFLISPLGLARNKICGSKIEERKMISILQALIEIFLTNLPFLILRILVWADCGYEASIFIAKNIIALGIAIIEIGVLCEWRMFVR